MSLNFEKFKTEAFKFVDPAKALGDAFIDTTEKMTDQQFKSCSAYSSIYFNQLKKVPDIQNLEDAGTFFWGQIEPFSEFNKQLLNDWKAVIGLNSDLINEAKGVFSTPKSEPTKEPRKKSAAKKPSPAKAQTAAPATATAKTEEKPKPVTKISKPKTSTARKTTTATSKS